MSGSTLQSSVGNVHRRLYCAYSYKDVWELASSLPRRDLTSLHAAVEGTWECVT